MTRYVTFKVEGINSQTGELEVINSLRKYSGVLNINVSLEKKVTVHYDPNNIIETDLMQTIEKAGYEVETS